MTACASSGLVHRAIGGTDDGITVRARRTKVACAYCIHSQLAFILTTEIDNFLRAAEIDSQYPRPAVNDMSFVKNFESILVWKKESCTERRHLATSRTEKYL